MTEHAEARATVVRTARTLIDRGALSLSLHGNISLRVADDRLLMTGSSLANLAEDDLAVLDLDGAVIDGHVSPSEHEVIRMHTAIYGERPDTGCVIHTHSPHATAFAVAGQRLPLVAESLARWDVVNAIPSAQWAPRGSEDAVNFILEAIRTDDATPAVLLQNHGILVWGRDANQALRRTIAIEENAQLAVLAGPLGGATEMTPEQARLAVARRDEFRVGGGT